MFLTDIYSAEYPGPSTRIKKTIKVRKQRSLFEFVFKINTLMIGITIKGACQIAASGWL